MNINEVIARAKTNDQKAFNYLLNTFWDDVYRFQLKHVQNENEAEDITIRTFSRAFDKIETFNTEYTFKTWLITISKNIHIDLLRKKKQSINQITTKEDKDAYYVADESPSAEDKLITEQHLATLLRDIKKLKPHYQDIINLRYFQELSYKEISEKLNAPMTNVKVKLLRAKKLLAEIIQEKKQMIKTLKQLGPGLLFAGAAIGVSHLVQSTRAGADFGFGLLWALLLVNLFKYPFFQFGPRYATATGESLLEGYKKLGKGVLIIYYLLNLATMFTIQTAVTIVTAGIATSLFGNFISVRAWTIIILIICLVLLIIGKYKVLDRLMKVIIITLTISTIIAVTIALLNNTAPISFKQILPENHLEIAFLIAFMGWMPAPLDVSVWQSLWAIEKGKETEQYSPKSALFDFNIGYLSTIILGIGFLTLGALVMFGHGESFSHSASVFSGQLIAMYTSSLGNWAYVIIGIAAFTTMFSTTLTTLDASPRAMAKTTQLLFKKSTRFNYLFWIITLTIGTVSIFLFLASEMGFLIKIATILSFITAPFFAIINYRLITSKHTPENWRPSTFLKVLSILGILFLISFSLWFLTTL